jgi:hypothetical protein
LYFQVDRSGQHTARIEELLSRSKARAKKKAASAKKRA